MCDLRIISQKIIHRFIFFIYLVIKFKLKIRKNLNCHAKISVNFVYFFTEIIEIEVLTLNKGFLRKIVLDTKIY